MIILNSDCKKKKKTLAPPLMSPLLRPGYDHAKAHARTLPLHKIQKGPYFQCEKIKPVNSSLQNNNNNNKKKGKRRPPRLV